MWLRLDRWIENFNKGWTKEKYLSLCAQVGDTPKAEKCPPGFEDLPEPVRQAIEVYNKLGDRVYPDVGFIGKDYTLAKLLMEQMGVANEEIFIDALVRLDAEMKRESQEQLKNARKAAERGKKP